MIEISISIVVHKTDLRMLAENLSSVISAYDCLNKIGQSGVTLYIIDNSLSDEYFQQLKLVVGDIHLPHGLKIELIKLDFNMGYGKSNNVISPALSSEYHLILNPDVWLYPDALAESLKFMIANPKTVMLTPSIEEEGGKLSHVAKTYPDCLTLFLRYIGNRALARIFEKRLRRYSYADLSSQPATELEVAGGCYMFLRTQDFLALEGFDERFFMYFEDFDFSLRIRKLGRISYARSVQVKHAGGDVGRKTFRHHLYFCSSALKFFNKHGWKFT
ncbi:glycosyltransferase [Microbulbifer yueqingensis]|uniref:Uncharacterized protein n=1 Tax=Microbulbifer yueqingensis TaxID=658219 RepID=A0A1G9A9D8_9GAMM|nr:glycosyltransferase [Microbulbifer yueqingensis]SDK23982.1 hypothetical protein SAMN05216212_1905 [Microbulbifer yueqingensis]